jgi:hypothetical protein
MSCSRHAINPTGSIVQVAGSDAPKAADTRIWRNLQSTIQEWISINVADLIAGFDYRQRQNFAGVWPLQILINDQRHRKEQNGGGADQLFNGVAMHHFSLPAKLLPQASIASLYRKSLSQSLYGRSLCQVLRRRHSTLPHRFSQSFGREKGLTPS